MKRLSREGTVRIGPAAHIPEILRSLGIEPSSVLDEAGLEPQLFDDTDNLISFAARSHLFALCQEKTGCDHFGLLLGKQAGLQSLGLVGYLAQNSPNVGSALSSLVRYFHLHGQGSAVSLNVEADMAFLGYTIYQPGAEATSQIEDAAVAIIYNVLNTLCGPGLKPVEVCFAHRLPDDTAPFKQFFDAPLRFDAEHNGVYFDAKYLNQTIKAADPELYRILQKQINHLEEEFADDFPEQVRRVLITALLMGHAKADQIAALFSIHSRTLNRRLKSYNTSFKKLADEVRYEITKQLLEASDMEVQEISEIIGYCDTSAFTKAFKRWSGTTPAHWRVKHNK
jgi:AraC-like DNA-binding protein